MAGLFAPKQRIVVEGDSLNQRGPETWPFLRIVGWDRSWADTMAEWFFVLRPDLNLNITNVAVGGSTIDAITERYERTVQPKKPDWVMLSLGTNDANRRFDHKEVREKVAAYCQRLREDSGGRVIYIPMPAIDGEMPAEEAKAFNQRRKRMYKNIAKVITEHDGVVLDFDAAFRKKARLLRKQAAEYHKMYGDGCHFSELGNRLLCGEICAELGYPMLQG